MKGRLLTFRRRSRAESVTGVTALATVTEAEAGHAKAVRSEADQQLHPVLGHADSTARIGAGDRVLVSHVNAGPETGCVVLARLRAPAEQPAMHWRDDQGTASLQADGIALRSGDWAMEMNQDQAMCLSGPGNSLELDDTGQLRLDGVHIRVEGTENILLTGRRIDLD